MMLRSSRQVASGGMSQQQHAARLCRAAAARGVAPRRGAAVVVRAEQQQAATNVCRTCGIELSKAPGGCDGEGRIIGGLAALPGFGWWPIKAYKPCDGLNSAGVDYVRKGQATNEMLFGGVSLAPSQEESLESMKEVADRGINVDV